MNACDMKVELFEDGCHIYWKDHCVLVGNDLWRFADGVLVLKGDPSMELNHWRQCAIRRHETEVSQ